MSTVDRLLEALDELTIADKVHAQHYDARHNYPLKSSTLRSFGEFSRTIGDYYNYHHSTCIAPGGRLSRDNAASRAKAILNQAYRRLNGDVVMAFQDAIHNRNGGLYHVLDVIAEALRTEAEEHYVQDVFDRYVEPHAWEQKVAIMREFLARLDPRLRSQIRCDQPERYAQNYKELVQGYLASLWKTSAAFRRF